MSSDDPVKKLLNDLVHNVKDTEQRHKMETFGAMIASIGIAHAIPGFANMQFAFQAIDYIDPFGYNQAISRHTLDQILTPQYTKIQEMQKALSDCYTSLGENKAACATAGIDEKGIETFKGYDDSFREKLVKLVTSWAYPIDPIVQYPSALGCTISTDDSAIKVNCKNDDYKKFYLDYWNAHIGEFQADAKKASDEAIKRTIASMTADPETDTQNKQVSWQIKGLIAAGFVIVVLTVFVIAHALLVKKK